MIGIGPGFAIGAVAGATYEIVDALVDGREVEWGQVGKTALEFGTTCAIVGGVSGAAAGFGGSLGCFTAGTQIATADGYMAIEDVEVGDKVLSRNDVTGATEEKTVQETFVKSSNDIVKLTVDGKEITATSNHPFYVANKNGYFSAGQLRAGDILVDVNGKKQILEKVQHEILERPIDVYNFTVEDNHNYFVGKRGVLVHNSCLAVALKGREVVAIVAATAILGMTYAQILAALDAGVLTWPDIFNPPQDNTDEKTHTREKIGFMKPSEEPPENEKIYHFAYILNGDKAKLNIDQKTWNYVEAAYILVGLGCLTKAHNTFIQNILDEFVPDKVLLEFITSMSQLVGREGDENFTFGNAGFYATDRNDAYKLASIFVVDDTDLEYTMDVQVGRYLHFHLVSDYENKGQKVKMHIWYGEPVI